MGQAEGIILNPPDCAGKQTSVSVYTNMGSVLWHGLKESVAHYCPHPPLQHTRVTNQAIGTREVSEGSVVMMVSGISRNYTH